MEQVLGGGSGVTGKERVNVELGRGKALWMKVCFASQPVLAKTVSSCCVSRGVQVMHVAQAFLSLTCLCMHSALFWLLLEPQDH